METKNEIINDNIERDKHINSGVVPEEQLKGSDADTNLNTAVSQNDESEKTDTGESGDEPE